MSNKKRNNIFKKRVIIVLLIIFLCLVAIILFNYCSTVIGIRRIYEYEQKEETRYKQAVNCYNKGDFKEAITIFQGLGNYENSNVYLNNSKYLYSIQGTWIEHSTKIPSKLFIQINGWNIEKYKYLYKGKYFIDGETWGNISLGKVSFYKENNVSIKLADNKIEMYYSSLANDSKLKKYEDETIEINDNKTKMYLTDIDNKKHELILFYNPPAIMERSEPKIGMTKKELEKSTWGTPEDINRTTTANGVREQWCYSNYRYIYLNNGIVTSIQD